MRRGTDAELFHVVATLAEDRDLREHFVAVHIPRPYDPAVPLGGCAAPVYISTLGTAKRPASVDTPQLCSLDGGQSVTLVGAEVERCARGCESAHADTSPIWRVRRHSA